MANRQHDSRMFYFNLPEIGPSPFFLFLFFLFVFLGGAVEKGQGAQVVPAEPGLKAGTTAKFWGLFGADHASFLHMSTQLPLLRPCWGVGSL